MIIIINKLVECVFGNKLTITIYFNHHQNKFLVTKHLIQEYSPWNYNIL